MPIDWSQIANPNREPLTQYKKRKNYWILRLLRRIPMIRIIISMDTIGGIISTILLGIIGGILTHFIIKYFSL